MYKYVYLFIIPYLLLLACNSNDNRKKSGEQIERYFDRFHYIYHFTKEELEQSKVDPAAFKPKVFDISGLVSAQLYKGDTLVRFVMKSKAGAEKKKPDSTIELFRLIKLEDREYSRIPSMLLGCKLLGVYNSSDPDVPENFYTCFYKNDQNDLLKVVHMFRIGNVAAAFFYTKDSIEPAIYKDDLGRLLSLSQPLSLTDTAKLTISDTLR